MRFRRRRFGGRGSSRRVFGRRRGGAGRRRRVGLRM